MDRNDVKVLRIAINKKLEELKVDFPDFDISVGNARYTDTKVTFSKLECVQNGNGNGVSNDEAEYNKYVNLYNLPPYGTTIALRGRKFVTVGFKARNRKYPVIVKGTDGKQYKLSEKQVATATRL
jgi:hypothetical protein